MNYLNLPTDIIATAQTAYVRLHGNPRLFYSEYSDEDLRDMLHQLERLKLNDAIIYFNNTASPAGILNALSLQRMQRGNP